MTKRLPLSQGKYALVEDDDFEYLNQWKWSARRARKTFYALRAVYTKKSGGGYERKEIYLHREIMNAPSGMGVDHINGNGLDCRRANMRLATNSENTRNSRMRSDNTSGYRGVTWDKRRSKWQVYISVNGKRIHIGYLDDPIEAAEAYDKAARKYHGEFARINFPES